MGTGRTINPAFFYNTPWVSNVRAEAVATVEASYPGLASGVLRSAQMKEGHIKNDRNAGRAWRAIRQSGLILLLAVVTGLLTNQARSNTLPLAASWAPEARLTADTGNSMVVGLQKVQVLLNGWTRWLEAGLPVEKGETGRSDGRKG
jgi:hypothetical protein